MSNAIIWASEQRGGKKEWAAFVPAENFSCIEDVVKYGQTHACVPGSINEFGELIANTSESRMIKGLGNEATVLPPILRVDGLLAHVLRVFGVSEAVAEVVAL